MKTFRELIEFKKQIDEKRDMETLKWKKQILPGIVERILLKIDKDLEVYVDQNVVPGDYWLNLRSETGRDYVGEALVERLQELGYKAKYYYEYESGQQPIFPNHLCVYLKGLV